MSKNKIDLKIRDESIKVVKSYNIFRMPRLCFTDPSLDKKRCICIRNWGKLFITPDMVCEICIG